MAADPQAPSRPSVLAQRGQVGGENFALLLADGIPLEDGDVSVKFKILGGTDYEAIGIVYRYQNPDDHHVLMADAKDDSCTLYQVKDGRRKPLDNKAAIVTAGVWHSLRVVFRQAQYMVFLDGELVLADKERGARHRGPVGLVTAGDTTALFDDLTINP